MSMTCFPHPTPKQKKKKKELSYYVTLWKCNPLAQSTYNKDSISTTGGRRGEGDRCPELPNFSLIIIL